LRRLKLLNLKKKTPFPRDLEFENVLRSRNSISRTCCSIESKTKGCLSSKSREFLGNAWEDCTSERRVFGKIFDSGLKQSLFLPGLSALSTKLITVQRALFCLVCLFLPTAHPTSPFLAQILSFLLPLFFSHSAFPLALSLDLCVVVSFLSLFLSLPLRLSFSPQTFCRMACFTAGRSPSVCLPEKSPLRFDRRRRFSVAWPCAFSIIGRVLPSPKERSRESTCPTLPRLDEPSCAVLNRHGRKPRYARHAATLISLFLARAAELQLSCARACRIRDLAGFTKEIDCRLYNHNAEEEKVARTFSRARLRAH